MEILHLAALAAVLLAAPFLLGMLFGKRTISGTYIAGVLLLWGSFEAAAIAANLRGWDFQTLSRRFFYVFAVLLCAGMVVFCIRMIKRKRERRQFPTELLLILPAFLLVGSLFFLYAPKLESWYLVPETVNTILDTNSLHGYNPLTGQLFLTEKQFGWSLLNLPAFYGCLINWCQVDTAGLLFRWIPLWMLFISFLVYYQFAGFFFGEWKKGRILCMWAYSLVLLLGDQAYMNEAYQMLHYAYEGKAVLTGILLPYGFYLLLSAFSGALKNGGKTEEGKESLIIPRVLIWLAEYVLFIGSGLFAMGADYGLGLPITMTVLSCIVGGISILGKSIWKKRDKELMKKGGRSI
ncbi:MAG: hypothetical protein HDR01_07465 [Lachnospiraceae bacterium]|nr:hypothetical protein [Lachnospiraceae bacterium]